MQIRKYINVMNKRNNLKILKLIINLKVKYKLNF